MGQTNHYHWRQPEPWEEPEREGVCQSLAEIDETVYQALSGLDETLRSELAKRDTSIQAVQALAGAKCRMICGTYIGSNEEERYINLGAAPKVVLLEVNNGMRPGANHLTVSGGLALPNAPLKHKDQPSGGLLIQGSGFRVYDSSCYDLNNSLYSYYYLALL